MKITAHRRGAVVRVSTSSEHVPDVYGRNDQTYTDTEQMLTDMRNPLYKTSASFREAVKLKVARSGVTEVSDPNAAMGSFQMHPQEPDPSAPLSEHDAAMVAKAERHGF